MSTAAYTAVEGFAATIRARIWANRATLGNIVQVLDRDEDPAILANHPDRLPTVCVIPRGQGKDTINFTMGGDDFLHEEQVHIVGYYKMARNLQEPYDEQAAIRQYAYGIAELFRGRTAGVCNFCFNKGVIYKATVEIKPYQEFDFVLDRYLITLFVKFGEN